MAVAKLTFSTLAHRKARVALTVAAIALSVSLVVAVTSGYASLEAAVFRYFAEFMGQTDIRVIPKDSDFLDEAVVKQMRGDSDFRQVIGRLEVNTQLVDIEGKPIPNREWQTASLIGVRLPEDIETGLLKMDYGPDTGAWFTGSRGNVAVIDQECAKLLNVKLGGEIRLPSPTKTLKLKVVGIVRKPAILAQMSQSIYVPLETLQQFLDMPGRVNTILVDVQPGANIDMAARRWQITLPAARVITSRDTRKDLDQHLQGIQFMSYMGGTISMLAAAFIVFSTLSMGVMERQRLLAMLRAIGATRFQVARVVVFEGLALASAGVVTGVPLGFLWIVILVKWKAEYFVAGTVLSGGGIVYSALAAIGTAVAACILPAWSASRVDPVEGMSGATRAPSRRSAFVALGVGVLLLAVDPALIFLPGMPRLVTFYGHFVIGLPCLMLGFFLLAPASVLLVDRSLHWIVARAMGISPRLLAHQLSGSLWRGAGTGAALMVGLGILVVMQTHGNTLLNGWKLPTNFPDIFIFSLMRGMTPEEVKIIGQVEGIEKDQVQPIMIARPGLKEGFFSAVDSLSQARKWAALALPDATMFLGFEPYPMLRIMHLDFRAGNADDAAYKLTHSIVTLKEGSIFRGGTDPVGQQLTILWRVGEEHRIPAALVRARTGAGAAETITLSDGTPITGQVRQEGQTLIIASSVAGRRVVAADQVVSRPRTGRYVIVTEEFRRLQGLTVGHMLQLQASSGQKHDYEIVGVVWSPGMDVFVSKFDIGGQFTQRSAGSVFGTLEAARDDFGEKRINLLAANLVGDIPRVELEKRVAEKLGGLGLGYGDVREIKAHIEMGLRKLLLLMSTVALAAIGVASLGVTNTIMASVRTRRWQLGVLRSIGVTRGQMLRMIVAEGILLGLVGCVLGLGAGLLMSLDANGLGVKIIGYGPPIDVPWDKVGVGVGIILAVAFLASLFPAASAAKEEPLSLLQAGRSGT